MKKQVVLLCWDILEAGGINSVIMGYQSGFPKLGYEVVTYYASKNGKLKLSEDEFTLNTKWFRPKAKNLGWDNDEQIKEYGKDVKKSEFVLSVHGAPHPTKSGAKGDYGWHRLYELPRKLKVPIAIQFTDNLWDKLYPWIVEIIDKKTKLFYDNYNTGFDSLTRLPYDSEFVDHPIDFDAAHPPAKKRKIDVCWMPQWKKWKGIYELIDQLSYEPNSFYTVLFNSGIEYYNIRKESNWKKAIRLERRSRTGVARYERYEYDKIIHNPESNTDYFGMVFPDQVSYVYAHSKVSLDLAGAYSKKMAAQYSYCMLEPMLNGCVVAASPEIVHDKRSRVGGLDIVYPVEVNALVDSLEEIIRDDKRRVRLTGRAYDWAHEFCRDEVVAQKVIEGIRSV